ncbi:ectonucleoside triphosphate diphosphohydrolase 5-like [Panonychus citri]|uniref:ectonucleoside triphosphate diphosphohydrolase 5-like n=1 Tax=Panonychus citri TaxID=50023 RepID=UPI002307A6D9|nr:ectonucleoside triphosphate diphosphohydrolase 5-like [Panonychus citri]
MTTTKRLQNDSSKTILSTSSAATTASPSLVYRRLSKGNNNSTSQLDYNPMDRLPRNPTVLPLILVISIYLIVTFITVGFGPFALPSLTSSSSVVSPSSPSSPESSLIEKRIDPKNIVSSSRSSRLIEASTSYKTHSIVFDAGSTGTRIHVFTFRITNLRNGGKKVKLLNEDFKQVKPGLSAYADEPKEAANSLIPLLEIAFKRIPISKRSSTPLTVKATAGLRLLPGDQADAILDEVDTFLRNLDHPFKMESDSSVTVMDGEDEGVFGWFTINFLLNLLNNDLNSVAHLDLGGGSTQVTFPPIREKTVNESPEGFIVERNLIGTKKQLYTHSYLGFGLMSSRKGILQRSLTNGTYGGMSKNNIIHVNHPCFLENTKTSWVFEGRTYLIEGVEGDCFKIARDYVTNQGGSSIFNHPRELVNREIYAISYYYDRASDVGLVNATQNGGGLRVKDYYLAAKMFCGSQFDKSDPNTNRQIVAGQPDVQFNSNFMMFNDAPVQGINGIFAENPFICLDLAYITNLLNAGYDLDWQKEINVVKKVKGVESSWALGAAVSLIR